MNDRVLTNITTSAAYLCQMHVYSKSMTYLCLRQMYRQQIIYINNNSESEVNFDH